MLFKEFEDGKKFYIAASVVKARKESGEGDQSRLSKLSRRLNESEGKDSPFIPWTRNPKDVYDSGMICHVNKSMFFDRKANRFSVVMDAKFPIALAPLRAHCEDEDHGLGH
jgi:hypothetical protein